MPNSPSLPPGTGYYLRLASSVYYIVECSRHPHLGIRVLREISPVDLIWLGDEARRQTLTKGVTAIFRTVFSFCA